MLDTPGLNAIGAEPELTLSLLPSAHATVFILGADTGVTKSDLAIWRDHLGAHAPTRFVVLNKIDALEDPLATLEQVEAQIAQQQRETARTLGVPLERVFPLSARQALPRASTATRWRSTRAGCRCSRRALGAQLLPQRRQVLEQVVAGGRAADREATSRATSATRAASSPSRRSSCAACAARTARRCG